MQSGRGGPGLAWQGGQFFVRGLLTQVEPLEVGDELSRDTLSGLADDVPRPNTGEDLADLGRGQVALGPTRYQFQQKRMQLIDLVGVLLPDGAAPVHADRSTSRPASATTGRSPDSRVPTSATECGSVA